MGGGLSVGDSAMIASTVVHAVVNALIGGPIGLIAGASK